MIYIFHLRIISLSSIRKKKIKKIVNTTFSVLTSSTPFHIRLSITGPDRQAHSSQPLSTIKCSVPLSVIPLLSSFSPRTFPTLYTSFHGIAQALYTSTSCLLLVHHSAFSALSPSLLLPPLLAATYTSPACNPPNPPTEARRPSPTMTFSNPVPSASPCAESTAVPFQSMYPISTPAHPPLSIPIPSTYHSISNQNQT